jgi:hypothetical protein
MPPAEEQKQYLSTLPASALEKLEFINRFPNSIINSALKDPHEPTQWRQNP